MADIRYIYVHYIRYAVFIFTNNFLAYIVVFSIYMNRSNGQRHLTLNEPCVYLAIHSDN